MGIRKGLRNIIDFPKVLCRVKYTRMKKLLMLTYYFPPLGLGGTQRAVKFAKYLPQFGWQPTVITVKPVAYWAYDDSLLNDVKNCEIIRTESFDPQRILTKFAKKTKLENSRPADSSGVVQWVNQKLFPFFLIPDSKILWKWHVKKTVKDLDMNSFDVMFSTSPPHSTHIIAKILAKQYGLKWIADFRDGWAGSHVVHEPTPLQHKINQWLEKNVVKNADAVLAVSPGIVDSLRLKNGALDKYHYIPNGFDPEDYNDVKIKKRSKKFIISYIGTINKFARPDGFLKGLGLFLHNYPHLNDRISIKFVGLDTLGQFDKLIKHYQVQTVVDYLGFKPHNQAVEYLFQSDALLLIATGREQDTFIPGKTFEYISTGKPIIAISNSRYTNDLLSDYSSVFFLRENDYQGISDFIFKLITREKMGVTSDQSFINKFNRFDQTRVLAKILDDLTK